MSETAAATAAVTHGMDFTLVVLVLTAALLHASWNAMIKSGSDRLLSMTLIIGFGSVAAGAALPLVNVPAPESWIFLLISALVHTGYFFFLVRAYQAGDLSHIYPVARGSAPLLVAIGAALLAGEIPTIGEIAGLALASLGIAAFALERGNGKWDGRPFLMALCVAVFIGVYTVTDGLGVRLSGDPMAFILWLFFISGLPLIAYSLVFRRRDFMPYLGSHWLRTGVLGGTICAVAYGIVIWALARAPMAHVSAMRETSVVFAAIIGAVFLGESFGFRRVLAALTVAAGITAMRLL